MRQIGSKNDNNANYGQNPCSTNTNPPSTTVIKASFWGNVLNPIVATNSGQYRKQFQVVIAGSNAYNVKEVDTAVTGYTQTQLNNCAMQAPGTLCTTGQTDSLLARTLTFQDGVLDHSRCQKACDNLTGDNACKFFTSYMLVTNGKCGVQQCAFYKRAWDPATYCKNYGQGNISIQWSSSFTSTADDGCATCPVKSRSLF